MKYKKGDRVRIKSLEWYKSTYKDDDGDIKCDGHSYFFNAMQEFCGEVVTIEQAYGLHYSIVEDVYGWQWTDDMIECLVEPATKMVSLDKVCEWLENKCENKREYISGLFGGPCSINIMFENISKDLRKAMEE